MKDNLYNTKGGFELKDLDEGKRQVAVYLSKFDSMDSDNDIIRPGAFAKSIQERGPMSSSNRKIAFLRHHDWEKQIGKFLSLEEDGNGLYAVAQLGRSTMGEDAYRDYEDGIIKEHSIGFQYIPDKVKFVEDDKYEKGGYYDIKEVKLFEGSAVTFGSNEFTNVVDVKSGNKRALLTKLNDNLQTCLKALLNGRGTDERLYELEMKVKHLSSQIILLSEQSESAPGHSVKSEPKRQAFEWEAVIKGLEVKEETFSDYPKSARSNARKGMELNEAVGNSCATAVGKQRANQIASGEALSLSTLKRTYSFLSRAEVYYNPSDEKACGTISFLLWGGKSMLGYCRSKLDK